MSSKDQILSNIQKHIKERIQKPDIAIDAISYPDKIARFKEVMKEVGGDTIEIKAGDDLNEVIKSLYPDAKVIASNIPEITISTINPDNAETPYELNGTDLGIVRGVFGVAENACVWIPRNVKEKAVYFISENLVIILNRKDILNNMHEAYQKIEGNDFDFGAFISGPSKTADIEQALVVGAHGAKAVTVIIEN